MDPTRVQESLASFLAELQGIAEKVGELFDLISSWITLLETVLPQDLLFITDFVQSLLQFLKDVIV